MDIIRIILAGLFFLTGLLLAGEAWRVRQFGLLLGAMAYGVSGVLAFELAAWWPLFVGFAGAWALRLMGADPPRDINFDLPTLDRDDVNDADQLAAYLNKWVSTDSQVGLITSQFANEAWDRGYRKPSHLPDAPEWSATTAFAAWRQMMADDLRNVASADKRTTIRYLDQIDLLSTPTLIAAGEAAVRYDLPANPSSFAEVEARMPDPRELAGYASAYVGDALLAGRLRVLAWTFQQWYGERYEIPQKRGIPA